MHEVLVSHDGPAWLPEGARADVVLATPGAAAPVPTCLVRLLVTRDRRVLTVPRPDGRGLDIPTQAVRGSGAAETLRTLLVASLGGVQSTTLLGHVRNVVPTPPDDYPWPVPDAHFVVWHCPLGADVEPAGEWLDPVSAEVELGERHRWPLAAHVLR